MWDDARQLNAIAVTLTVIALAFLAWAGAGWVARQPLFGIREVVVTTPLKRASAAHLDSVIRGELSGTFFTMDLDAARESISHVPWVRAVALRRQWPHRLEVAIDEHQPLARWNDNGLVDTQGDVFVASYAGDLPQFDGPDGQSQVMAQRYRQWGALLAPLALRVDGPHAFPTRRLADPRAGRRRRPDDARRARRRRRAACTLHRRLRTHAGRAVAGRQPRRPRRPEVSKRIRGARAGIPRKTGAPEIVTAHRRINRNPDAGLLEW